MKIETSKQDFLIGFVGLAGLVLIAIGCQTLYTTTITLTQVVDSATREYAHAYNSGLVPAETASKVAVAYEAYRKAAGVAHDALVAYKQTGAGDTSNAIQTAKQAASQLIDLVVPFLTAEKASQIKTQLSKANAP